MRAIWNGQVIADSMSTINLEGNTYFPPESVRKEFLIPGETSIPDSDSMDKHEIVN